MERNRSFTFSRRSSCATVLETAGCPTPSTRAAPEKEPASTTRVPVLVQTDTATGKHLALSESAAILVYLAERQGQLLPAVQRAIARVNALVASA